MREERKFCIYAVQGLGIGNFSNAVGLDLSIHMNVCREKEE